MRAFLSSCAFSFLSCGILYLGISSLSQAQTPQARPNPPQAVAVDNFWQASFNDGGHYMVRLANISSVSKHEYVSNGTARVVEVTIGSSANVTARFYYYEPAAAKVNLNAAQIAANRLKDLAQNSASKVVNPVQVTKDYPTSTHAHTVEYALQSEEELNTMYQSLVLAVRGNDGAVWQEAARE